jgi:predicted Zn-dependent protease with MMP-like domain
MTDIAARPSERRFGTPPSLAEIEAIARQAFERLPAILAARCRGIAIRIEDFADEETLSGMGIESPFDLAGLYRGTPLTAKTGGDVATDVDMVLLYRRALLDWWAEDEVELEDLVRHVLVHEIGHHFGFSDDDMERIENEID